MIFRPVGNCQSPSWHYRLSLHNQSAPSLQPWCLHNLQPYILDALPCTFQILSLTAVSKRATSIQVRTDHGFVRTQEFACLSHEVHATHNHYLGIGFCSFTSQSQRVANKVGDVLNLTYRIVVGEDNSIFLLAKLSDFSFQVQGFVNRFVNVSFLNPFFFTITFILYFLFLFFKREYRDNDMPWISG